MGRPCGEIRSVMLLQCHVDLRGLGGKCVCVAPCHWRARSREARWCKRGASLACNRSVWFEPLRRCACTARNAPRLALLTHNVALPLHLRIYVYTLYIYIFTRSHPQIYLSTSTHPRICTSTLSLLHIRPLVVSVYISFPLLF